MNFLEYKMRIAALLGCLRVPFDGQRFPQRGRAIEFCDRDAFWPQRDNFALIQNQYATRMFEDGRDIRCQVLFALANAHDERPTA